MARKTQITKIYKRVVTATMALVFVAAGVATATFSFSWFTNRNNVTNSSFEGKTAGAYFARGDGTADAPYVINKPIHLYNLAWLQYIGYFKDKEPYFIIESDLNMDGWVLPPIGTTENPFLGHLDGYDTVNSQTGQTQPAKIKNLTISNSLDDMSTRHPGSVTESTFTQPEITGLFGAVGDTSSSIVPTIQNLYLDKIQVESKTDNALTGIVAGYVNGQLSEIYLSDSSLDLKDGTNKLTGYDQISKYTSVGYCESKYQTEVAKYKTTLYEPEYIGEASFNPSGGGSGEDNDWGGSIDFESLSKRITYISKTTTPSNYIYNSSVYNTKLYETSKYDYSLAKLQFAALNDGTYLPLNINKEIMFNNGGEKYDGTTKEAVLSTNTGYIVGEGTGSSTYLRMMHNYVSASRNASYIISNSAYTINKNNAEASKSDSIASSNFSFAWLTNEGKTYRIEDDENKDKNDYTSVQNFSSSGMKYYGSDKDSNGNENGLNLTKYNDVKNNFINAISDATTDDFFTKNKAISLHYLQLKSGTAPTAKSFSGLTLNGSTNVTQDLFTGGINFTLKSTGTLTMLSGISFQGSGEKGDLPNIYEVVEDSGSKKLKQICKIYKDASGNIAYKYDKDSTLSNDETLIIDLYKMSTDKMMQIGAIYYFEFPLYKGNYFMTREGSGSIYVPYIYYLDIGANAGGGESGTAVQRTKIYEVLEQINEAFTYPTGISIVSFDNAVLDTKTLCVTLGSTYSGSASIKRTSETAADIVVTATSSTGLAYYDPTITVTNDSKIYDSDIISESVTTTQTRRLTYLDYYKEDKIINMFAFEQTAEITTSSTASWGDISMKQYTTEKESTEFTSTQNLTIHNDDGESVELSSITIEDPDSYDYSTNVFSLNLDELKPTDFSIDYVPTGSIDTDSNKFTVSGYKVTMSDVTYTLTSKNENYSLIINNVTK